MIKIKLGSKIVTDSSLPYIIAEIGVNHECSLSKAKKLILNAKKVVHMLQNFKLIKLIL